MEFYNNYITRIKIIPLEFYLDYLFFKCTLRKNVWMNSMNMRDLIKNLGKNNDLLILSKPEYTTSVRISLIYSLFRTRVSFKSLIPK